MVEREWIENLSEKGTETCIEVIDSHTAGEPTRVVVSGGPDLLGKEGSVISVAQQLTRFRDDFDHFRTAIITEPRGNDVIVGALLCPPLAPDADFGVIFFNNVGYLGMCGHGMIGLARTLLHQGRMGVGTCRIETAVGIVTTTIHQDHSVSVDNVESYRLAKDVAIDVPGIGQVVGDVAWGGNWFYLVKTPTFNVAPEQAEQLQKSAVAIRHAINTAGFPEVDHVEIFAADVMSDADSQNFVLCPGLAYDRSPCGTGTSAKLACLAADGTLLPGKPWIQAGVLGTKFIGHFQWSPSGNGRILPVVTGTAHVTAHSRLLVDPADPFGWGIVKRTSA